MAAKAETEKPTSAAKFASLWKNPGKEAIFNGNSEIPNVYIRQNRLVGQVLDACIILHVYEELKRGTAFHQLKFFFPDFTEDKFKDLAKSTDKKKLQKLMKMAKENQLVNHYALVSSEDWENYKATYRKAQKESPDKLPEDPRIIAINEIITPTIKLLNSGHKTPKATEAKAKRGERDICELRDINRVGVLPTKLEYAKDFIQIIKLLNLDKKIGNSKLPRFYEEYPEVLRNGYFNQKLFVAQDRSFGNAETTDNTATIAEIKIVPAEMSYAEKLSAATKQVVNLLDSKIKYISDDPNDAKEIKNNRDDLRTKYNEQKEKFEKLASATNKKYKWPKFDPDKENPQEAYDNLRNDLTYLSIQLHVDAMMEANRTWKEEYLKTAIKWELKNPKPKERSYSKLPPDILGVDEDKKSWLERIAESGHLDLKQIEKEVKIEMGLSKPPKQAHQAHR